MVITEKTYIDTIEETLEADKRKRFRTCLKWLRRNPLMRYILNHTGGWKKFPDLHKEVVSECVKYAYDQTLCLTDFGAEVKEKYLTKLYKDYMKDGKEKETVMLPTKKRKYRRGAVTNGQITLYLPIKYKNAIDTLGGREFVINTIEFYKENKKTLNIESRRGRGKILQKSVKIPLPYYFFLLSISKQYKTTPSRVILAILKNLEGG